MKDRVLLVGSYPPPYGGCSVHVMRLREALHAKFHVEVLDLYGSRINNDTQLIVRCGNRKPFNALRAVFALLRRPVRIVHFQVAGMDAFLYAAYPMLAALRAGTRKVVTIHSGSFVARFERGPLWRRLLLRDVLRRFDWIVTVNKEQRTYLESIGMKSERLRVIPAFLPPVARESTRVRTALETLRSCNRIIVSSGYGLPYYGFMCIVDALELLKAENDSSGILVCTYNTYDEAYISALERRFANGLPGVVLRDLAPEEFAWLLERCDVYVRATDRDGDAVAIREAHYFGKFVVASDCVERPNDVELFKVGDSHSLAHALRATRARTESSREDEPSGLTALLEIYSEALIA